MWSKLCSATRPTENRATTIHEKMAERKVSENHRAHGQMASEVQPSDLLLITRKSRSCKELTPKDLCRCSTSFVRKTTTSQVHVVAQVAARLAPHSCAGRNPRSSNG